MDVYVYETPSGLVADFRPYLDGQDHSFDQPRPLGPQDARWEKVHSLLCPRTDEALFGKVRYAGRGVIDDYHELMIFPVAYEGKVEPVDRPEPEGAGADDATGTG